MPVPDKQTFRQEAETGLVNLTSRGKTLFKAIGWLAVGLVVFVAAFYMLFGFKINLPANPYSGHNKVVQEPKIQTPMHPVESGFVIDSEYTVELTDKWSATIHRQNSQGINLQILDGEAKSYEVMNVDTGAVYPFEQGTYLRTDRIPIYNYAMRTSGKIVRGPVILKIQLFERK